MSMSGIPYAYTYTDPHGVTFAICPACGLRVDLADRKDFESFSGLEYQRHYNEEHE